MMVEDQSGARYLEPVHETVSYARPPGPGVDVRALLARPHVSHPALVPEVAHLRGVTSRRAVLKIFLCDKTHMDKL